MREDAAKTAAGGAHCDPPATRVALGAMLAGCIDDTLAAAAWRLIEGARRILILAHERPDPDALGSALGLAYALAPLGKQCVVACADGVPANYTFLPGRETVVTALPDTDFDLVIALDAGELERYGALYERNQAFFGAATILNIDHHVTSAGCGPAPIIDPTSAATAELLTIFLLNRGVVIGPEAARCLLAGLITDTRAFEYDATTARTLAAGGYLVSCGGVPQDIIKPMYRMKPLAKARLWGLALDAIQSSADGRLVWSVITPAMLAQAGATSDMDDGLSSYLVDIDGVAIAAVFKEDDEDITRLSLRCVAPYDVATISARFGGGGHVRAAGATLRMSLDEALRQVIPHIERALAEPKAGYMS
jgi:phosphoesterase RecJ-like protein